MEGGSRTVVLFSSKKGSPESAPLRQIQPSPEKKALSHTTAIFSKLAPLVGRTPNNEIYRQFDIELGRESKLFQDTLAMSKRIVLEHSLCPDGMPWGQVDFHELMALFPTTFAVEVGSYMTIRVRRLPPKPWPLSIGGLPVHITTDTHDRPFKLGEGGRGPKVLIHFDLLKRDVFSDAILREVVGTLREMQINISSVFWFAGIWQITVAERVDLKALPSFICSNGAFYKFASEISYPDSSALRNRAPAGVFFDDTLYVTSEDALLRPGIMLGSSVLDGTYKTTSSGILVVDNSGEFFVTVATHGFESDGLVYHPNPHSGILIGKIAKTLPGTDISLAKLNPGLRYINEVFGTADNPGGNVITKISSGVPPDLRTYDPISMNNPFSGRCDGLIYALGCVIENASGHDYIDHQWMIFENGDEPLDGSRGCPILDDANEVVGLFRFKKPGKAGCLAVSAKTLLQHGYQLCHGEQKFGS